MEQTCPQGVPSGSLADPCTRAPEGLQECANQKLTETRNSRKRKQQKKKNRSQTSGFCLLARSTVRKEGFTVPVGNERTCLPDAVWCLLKLMNVAVDQTSVRNALQPANDTHHDPNVDQVVTFCRSMGVEISYQAPIAGSPVGLFLQQDGMFLVRMEILTAEGADYHTITYHASSGRIFDNEPRGKVPVVTSEDRVSNRKALEVFKHLFPRAQKIILRGVWKAHELSLVAGAL